MPVTRALLLILGAMTLVFVWLGPLPELAPTRFSAHMTMHMGVVAVAAPLLALAVAGGRLDPARRLPSLFAAIPASVAELIVVWSWHTPSLHHVARSSAAGLVLEQSMFFVSGLWVWMSATGGRCNGGRAGAGVIALLLTSMHMTLLGALIALSPRALYVHANAAALHTSIQEQHLGGAIMLAVGGVVYLCGGLWLSAGLLNRNGRDANTAALRRRSV